MTGANWRAALMLMAGLLICIGTPSQAASSGAEESTQSDQASRPAEVKKTPNHKHHSADHPSGKPAEKSSDNASNVTPAFGAMPSSVVNAKAQVVSGDTPAAAAAAMTARANDNVHAAANSPQAQSVGDDALEDVQGDIQVVASDQLNDIDRASQESGQATTTPAPAAAPAPSPTAPIMAASRSESPTESSAERSTWDHTSLIGKIFVGIGTMLTLASAARMFLA